MAMDTNTNVIGSAGASCLDDSDVKGGATIISDLLPGKGAIHTQAFYRAANQRKAREKLQAGLSADSIIQWLIANDAFSKPEKRQYGIVRFGPDNTPQTAAFTGKETDSFRGHRTGKTYAIQGNILKGPKILDTMKASFLNTKGQLGKRLMAAMQAANIPGADRRCLMEGVSSRSAFLKTAKPGDKRDNLTLDLKVTKTPRGVEPIDSLHKLYKRFTSSEGSGISNNQPFKVRQVLDQNKLYIEVKSSKLANQELNITLFSIDGGKRLSKQLQIGKHPLDLTEMKNGFYFYRIKGSNTGFVKAGQLITF